MLLMPSCNSSPQCFKTPRYAHLSMPHSPFVSLCLIIPLFQTQTSCAGSALQIAYQLQKTMGGRMILMTASLPSVGLGALRNREDPRSTVSPLSFSHDIFILLSSSSLSNWHEYSIDWFSLSVLKIKREEHPICSHQRVNGELSWGFAVFCQSVDLGVCVFC